jgi:hypothetical protein
MCLITFNTNRFFQPMPHSWQVSVCYCVILLLKEDNRKKIKVPRISITLYFKHHIENQDIRYDIFQIFPLSIQALLCQMERRDRNPG